jgi:hypothetical protein
MAPRTPPAKPLTYRESGLIGARRRWGDPRLVRLDGLTSDQRRTILSLIDTFRTANGAEKAVSE